MTEKPWRRGGYLERMRDEKPPTLRDGERHPESNPPIEPDPRLLQILEPSMDFNEELIRAIAMTAILLVVALLLLVSGVILHAKAPTPS